MYSVNLNIFNYENYRLFLKDCVEELKNNNSKQFSYRLFAKHAGFSSPNFLLLLIQGERNVSLESAMKIAQVFKLKSFESAYFIELTKLNQAKTVEQQLNHLTEIYKIKSKSNFYELTPNQSEYFEKWYYSVIKEILFSYKKNQIEPSLSDLESLLYFKISVDEIKKTLTKLHQLQLIELSLDQWSNVSNTEKIKYTIRQITTQSNSTFHSTYLFSFHKQMIDLAQKALLLQKREDRFITACTVGLSKKNFHSIMNKINQLKEEILTLSEIDKDHDEIYQINFQLFQLTQQIQKK